MLTSGIGPRAYLEEQGIDVIFDSPGVGTQLVSSSPSRIQHDIANIILARPLCSHNQL